MRSDYKCADRGNLSRHKKKNHSSDFKSTTSSKLSSHLLTHANRASGHQSTFCEASKVSSEGLGIIEPCIFNIKEELDDA